MDDVDEISDLRERACVEMARTIGQVSFMLIAQDATADLVVDFCVMLQARVWQSVRDGLTLDDEVRCLLCGWRHVQVVAKPIVVNPNRSWVPASVRYAARVR